MSSSFARATNSWLCRSNAASSSARRPGRIGAGRIERAELAVAAGHEQGDTAQVLDEVGRIVGSPDVRLCHRVAEQGQCVVAEGLQERLHQPGRVGTGKHGRHGRVGGVQDATERRSGAEQLGMPSRVRHRTEASHRQACDRLLVSGAEPSFEDLAELGQMERFPTRLVAGAVAPPVGVEAEASPVGHHDQHIRRFRQSLDVARLGPIHIAPEPTVKEVEHGPSISRSGREARRQKDPRAGGLTERGGVDRDVDSTRVEDVLSNDS